ncbi:MAG: tRNA pseudouridine(55) synthase TruB [Candidatus Omnitrophota bacterium]
MEEILVVDKPSGMTSHDVVDVIRKVYNIRKVGHCGTLDPMATGVLVLLLGKATKLSAKLSAQDKEYVCGMKLGVVTDSHDSMGKVIQEMEVDNIYEQKIKEVIRSFVGKQQQVPPMVSAKQYKGKRLYMLARKGIEVKREPVDIEISDIEILEINKPFVRFKVYCSKGTYIRTLCNDIGQKLGCGAHMTELRRIASGKFHIDQAVKLEDLVRGQEAAPTNGSGRSLRLRTKKMR